MPPWLCEYAQDNLCIAHLLRDEANRRRSLPQRLDECRRWVLPKEMSNRIALPLGFDAAGWIPERRSQQLKKRSDLERLLERCSHHPAHHE